MEVGEVYRFWTEFDDSACLNGILVTVALIHGSSSCGVMEDGDTRAWFALTNELHDVNDPNYMRVG